MSDGFNISCASAKIGLIFMRIVGNNIPIFLLKAAIIVILILGGGGAGAVSTEAERGDVLRIIYSGSLTGNIEPCG